MSSATAIPVSPDLAAAFKAQNSRYYIVRIENEVLIKVYAHPRGSSIPSDWNTIAQKAENRACYILFELAPRSFITITFVPSDTKIRDKMVYAATKATLLNGLGYNFFSDELHANDTDELKYDYFVASKKPVSCLSASEEIRNQVHQQENAERDFRATIHAPTAAGASRPGQAAGIGGYHSVAMPLEQSAESLVREIVNGTATFVELAINPAQNGIIGVKSKNVPISGVVSEINSTEPRYYLVKSQGKNALVYCCPYKSPQKLRMVYSTAKGGLRNAVGLLGFTVSKTGEITEPSELNAQLIHELSGRAGPSLTSSGPSRVQAGGGQVPAARQSVISGEHPIYGLMGGGSGGRAKKIVLPPRGAY